MLRDKPGCAYGTHRVLEPEGVLPQAAWKVENSPHIFHNEILIDVETLNVDAASFRQILLDWGTHLTQKQIDELSHEKKDELKEAHVAAALMDIVSRRGKMHNPVTGSGGMLLGRIREFGPGVSGKKGAKVGDRLCTLVSLSLTPLSISQVKKVHLHKDQVDVEGTAVLFETGDFSLLPQDLGDKLSLAVLDVAGAPMQTHRLVEPGDTVLILGAGGKSGLLCSAVAAERVGPQGKVIGFDLGGPAVERLRKLNTCDVVIKGDATDALSTMRQVTKANNGLKADVTINCVNVPGTEMASILSTKDGGKVYFFSMATSFTQAALGAEGVGADVQLIIGNGYAEGHAEYSLNLVRNDRHLRDVLSEIFGEQATKA